MIASKRAKSSEQISESNAVAINWIGIDVAKASLAVYESVNQRFAEYGNDEAGMRAFRGITLTVMKINGTLQYFLSALSERQRRILQLLKTDDDVYLSLTG